MDADDKKPEIAAVNPKSAARAKRMKFIVLMTTTMASLFGLAAGSFAWFLEASKESTISAVMGDMDVQIDKVTAYKYIYPYIAGSAEFIDYEADPTLKGYVVQDSSVEFTGAASSTTTITLGSNATVTPGQSDPYGPRNVHWSSDLDFRYYIVGDAAFTAVDNDPWSTQTGIYFAQEQNLVGTTKAISSSVVISAGAKFTFLDKNNRGEGSTASYFTYASVSANSPFEIVDSGVYLRCLKSGIYDIEWGESGITIKKSRSDEALIGNNMFDPTNVILEYEASSPKLPQLSDYIPQGIYDQNTMVIFDVELTYTNIANPIDAGLKIRRGSNSSINQLAQKYNDTRNHRRGYVDPAHRNAITASDFYSFYAVFTKESNKFGPVPASGDDPARSAREAMWDAIHQKTDATGFRAFQLDPEFEATITYDLNLKETSGEDADSTLVPAGTTSKYHCYIGVDYDYDHIRFFFNENRLGNTYLLDRDFGFYFTSTQHLESDE